MEVFLQTCSAAVKASSQDSPGFHVVLGNEACDVDSMVSSLAFAYFLSRGSGPGKHMPIPVMNIPRAEFSLRSDSIFLLKEIGVPPETLVFRDELDLARLHGDNRLTLTLVDHNVLASTDQALEEVVVEVIDHHRLERPTSSSCSVTVETVGSCASLVTDRICRIAPEVLDRQLALLLYGTIVVDCVNMAPEAGKVTSRDSQVARLLETQFPDLPPRGALFQTLQNAKFDVSGLSTEQILLKDMKKVSGGDLRIAVCTVYLTLEMFLQRRALQQELCEFCHKHQLGLLVAMTISFNDNKEPFRQLAVYSSSTLYRLEVSQALEFTCSPSLNLTPLSSPYKDILAYHQGNALASRKKILPVLKDFLSDWERRQVHCGEVGEELEDQLDRSESSPSPGNGSDDLRPRVYSSSHHHRQRLLGGDNCGLEDEGGGGVPPTPMNSLVEGCPLDGPMPRMISQEALLEKFSRLGGGGGGEEEEEEVKQ
ncbi:LOW QUALITY PROTEIN: exopolyphosphatase PRUNE1-like [Aplochiton taeniatus]